MSGLEGRYERLIAAFRDSPRRLGWHTHHVVPKCLGGDDSPSNLVHLPPRAHYLAHWMLYRMYPEHPGISLAFILFKGVRRGRDFEEASLRHSEASRLRMILNNPQSGKPRTDSQKAAASNALTGKPKSESHRSKIAKARAGKVMSEEQKKKIGDAQRGKPRSEESRLAAIAGIKTHTCPHCGKVGRGNTMMLFHFDKCKERECS